MLTGQDRKGEKGRAEGFGGKVFNPENSDPRTQLLDTMLAIIGELGVSADQAAIACAGTHGAVPIIGSRFLAQLGSNLCALALAFSAEHLDRLDAVSAIDPFAPKKAHSAGVRRRTAREGGRLNAKPDAQHVKGRIR
jgi:aryl-alcohol dehydrogenase-like predicted oxidoreductase